MLAEDPQGGELAQFVPAIGQGADQLRPVRGALAGTFTASLELAKQGEVHQEEMFDMVRVKRAVVDPGC